MSNPLVSVILPVFNRERVVARAITSVLAQTYQHLEVIVVDDGSTDATRDVIRASFPRVTILEQDHRGVYAARNLGVAHARGELIAFIDSDDAWLPDRVASQVPLFDRPEVGLVFGDAEHVDASHNRTNSSSFRVSPPARGSVAREFAWRNFVPTISVLVRRRCLEEIGGFAEEKQLSADYLAWFRIALRHELDYVDRAVCEYTVHSESLSFDLGRALEARIALFSAELARTTDAPTAAILRRLLFNLSMHLVLAALRGRAKNVANPFEVACHTALRAGHFRVAPWTAAFAMNQISVRSNRYSS